MSVRKIRSQLRTARSFTPRLEKQEDPRYQAISVAQRGRTVDKVRRANQRWERSGARTMSREQYVRDVVPRLAAVKLSDLMRATGLTNASCSLIRRGLAIPHPRHWAALAGVVTKGVDREAKNVEPYRIVPLSPYWVVSCPSAFHLRAERQ